MDRCGFFFSIFVTKIIPIFILQVGYLKKKLSISGAKMHFLLQFLGIFPPYQLATGLMWTTSLQPFALPLMDTILHGKNIVQVIHGFLPPKNVCL